MRKKTREGKYPAIKHFVLRNCEGYLLILPEDAAIEEQDIVLYGGYVFLGQSDRTKRESYEFLWISFPSIEVIPFQLGVIEDYLINVLHLDGAFQTVGHDYTIIYTKMVRKNPSASYNIVISSFLFPPMKK